MSHPLWGYASIIPKKSHIYLLTATSFDIIIYFKLIQIDTYDLFMYIHLSYYNMYMY